MTGLAVWAAIICAAWWWANHPARRTPQDKRDLNNIRHSATERNRP